MFARFTSFWITSNVSSTHNNVSKLFLHTYLNHGTCLPFSKTSVYIRFIFTFKISLYTKNLTFDYNVRTRWETTRDSLSVISLYGVIHLTLFSTVEVEWCRLHLQFNCFPSPPLEDRSYLLYQLYLFLFYYLYNFDWHFRCHVDRNLVPL